MYKTYLGFFNNRLDIILVLVVLISAVYSGGSSLRVVISLLPCQEVTFHGLDIKFSWASFLAFSCLSLSSCSASARAISSFAWASSSFLLASAASSSLCFVNVDSSSEMVDSQSSWTKFKMSACSGWAFMVRLSLA